MTFAHVPIIREHGIIILRDDAVGIYFLLHCPAGGQEEGHGGIRRGGTETRRGSGQAGAARIRVWHNAPQT